MSKISFASATADEKEQLLGREFRNLDVLDFEAEDGVMITRVIFQGKTITLIGDPRDALKTYLGGQSDQVAQ